MSEQCEPQKLHNYISKNKTLGGLQLYKPIIKPQKVHK